MNVRDELIWLLARLVADGKISEQDAEAIVDFFDRENSLPEGWQLPLPLIEAIPLDLRDRIDQALLAHRGAVSLSPDIAQDEFINEAKRLARELSNGQLTLPEWHGAMVGLIIDYLSRQAQEGAKRALVGDDLDAFYVIVLTQIVYLSRFADDVAANRLSPAQIEQRAALYGGEGRAVWYEQEGLTNALWGYVEDYIALDDRNTCGPCARAEAGGPYLPGTGPMPGRVCLGRSACRCTRQLRYDPPAYLRLTAANPSPDLT